ncbi:ProQ/FINO family protein [Candidatus Odyssella thessalonicensis]|uniref:ProQ/FINO family protein n=1 Tax=Candidatus Odyssella thessalonicensis TaxID=84647 RepID=UPI000225B50C|nr:ProQ/FinO family protein [Candidatus Odyssella thessalonicensis]
MTRTPLTLSLNPLQKAKAQEKLTQLKLSFETGLTHQELAPTFKKKRPQSSQGKPASRQKQTQTQSVPDQDKNAIQARRERLGKIFQSLDWLMATYPNCFDKENPKPLKLRIEKDIFNNLPEELPFARHHIRKALAIYTKRRKYQKALVENPHRYDLSGNVVEEVSEEHKERALQRQLVSIQKLKLKKGKLPKLKVDILILSI